MIRLTGYHYLRIPAFLAEYLRGNIRKRLGLQMGIDEAKRIALTKEMNRDNRVIEKLNKEYTRVLNKSF